MEKRARLFEFKQKEVINVVDGHRLGFVSDVEIDFNCGKVTKIIISAPGKVFGVFGCDKEYVICWENIKMIGEDLIIVETTDNYLLDKPDKKCFF